MSDTPQRPQPPLSPNDALPPVEPPSAGFIVQLFVIPAVIVAIIIIVWATFNWLAHMGSDPRAHVEALKRNSSKQDTGISLRDGLRVFLNRQTACGDQLDETDTEVPQRKVVDRYGPISCLDQSIEPHDGRIRPVFE